MGVGGCSGVSISMCDCLTVRERERERDTEEGSGESEAEKERDRLLEAKIPLLGKNPGKSSSFEHLLSFRYDRFSSNSR